MWKFQYGDKSKSLAASKSILAGAGGEWGVEWMPSVTGLEMRKRTRIEPKKCTFKI